MWLRFICGNTVNPDTDLTSPGVRFYVQNLIYFVCNHEDQLLVFVGDIKCVLLSLLYMASSDFSDLHNILKTLKRKLFIFNGGLEWTIVG